MSQDQMDFSFPPLERGPQIRSTFQDQMDFSFNPLEREVLLITSQDQTDFSSPPHKENVDSAGSSQNVTATTPCPNVLLTP